MMAARQLHVGKNACNLTVVGKYEQLVTMNDYGTNLILTYVDVN